MEDGKNHAVFLNFLKMVTPRRVYAYDTTLSPQVRYSRRLVGHPSRVSSALDGRRRVRDPRDITECRAYRLVCQPDRSRSEHARTRRVTVRRDVRMERAPPRRKPLRLRTHSGGGLRFLPRGGSTTVYRITRRRVVDV